MLEILKSVYCQVCFGQRTNLTLLACPYLLAVARFLYTKSWSCSIPRLILRYSLSDSCALMKIDLFPISSTVAEAVQENGRLHSFPSPSGLMAFCFFTSFYFLFKCITISTNWTSFSAVSSSFSSSPPPAELLPQGTFSLKNSLSTQECSLSFHKEIWDKCGKLEPMWGKEMDESRQRTAAALWCWLRAIHLHLWALVVHNGG